MYTRMLEIQFVKYQSFRKNKLTIGAIRYFLQVIVNIAMLCFALVVVFLCFFGRFTEIKLDYFMYIICACLVSFPVIFITKKRGFRQLDAFLFFVSIGYVSTTADSRLSHF